MKLKLCLICNNKMRDLLNWSLYMKQRLNLLKKPLRSIKLRLFMRKYRNKKIKRKKISYLDIIKIENRNSYINKRYSQISREYHQIYRYSQVNINFRILVSRAPLTNFFLINLVNMSNQILSSSVTQIMPKSNLY